MSEPLRIALAQVNLLVGDVQGNAERVISTARRATGELRADLVLFPELTLSGYPPEDLLFHRGFRRKTEEGLARLRRELGDAAAIVGFPEYAPAGIYNSAALIAGGELIAIHRKAELPNYKVFDEKRYFEPGAQPTVADCRGFRVGLLVCEDTWQPEAAQLSRSAGAELLVVINASPYEIHKQREREDIARSRARDVGLPLAYVNLLGGQDELVFDGNSFVMDAEGEVVMRARPCGAGAGGCGARAHRPGERLRRAHPRGARLREEARLPRSGDGALGRRRFRPHSRDRGGCPRQGQRAGRDDALALYLGHEPRGCTGAGPDARREVQRAVHRGNVREHARGAQGRVRGSPAGRHGGEHPVPLPHAAAHGDLEQDRPDAPHDRQQERDGRGACDALRRHGRRLRADQGLQQAPGVPPRELPELPRPRDSAAGDRARAVRGASAGTERLRLAAALRGARPDPGSVHRGGPVGG